jgi:hypothetical protein
VHTSAGPVEIVARAKKEHPADGDSRRIHHTRAATDIARKYRQLREGSGVVRFDRRNVRLRETYKSGEDNMVPQCRCAETLVVILLMQDAAVTDGKGVYARVLDIRIDDIGVTRIAVSRIAEASLRQDVAVAERGGAEETPSIKGGPAEEAPAISTKYHPRGPELLPRGTVKEIVSAILPANADSALLT